MLRRFIPALITFAAVAGMLTISTAAQRAADPSNWTERVKPYRIIANIYYVGTLDLSSFLITSPEGHVLIDTGLEQNADAVLDNIRTLGFTVKDVRVILTTQAHYDHVGAHTRLKKESGARVLVSAADAPIVEGGGEGDYLFGAEFHYRRRRSTPPFTMVKWKVGPIALTAHLTPGHTKGTTTWTMAVKDSTGRDRNVVFLGSTTVNPGTKLLGNSKYLSIDADYTRAFEVQKALPCEVFLAAHASVCRGPEKSAAAASKGDSVFVDPQGCRAAIERSEKAFSTDLERQRAGSK
jgi:metallo-beta-lactamase class B